MIRFAHFANICLVLTIIGVIILNKQIGQSARNSKIQSYLLNKRIIGRERVLVAVTALFKNIHKFKSKYVSWLKHPFTGKSMLLTNYNDSLALTVDMEGEDDIEIREICLLKKIVFVRISIKTPVDKLQTEIYERLPENLQMKTVLYLN